MESADIIDNNICRICFQVHYITIPLYSEKDGSSPYEKLVSNTKLNIAVNDGGPDSICGQCNNELNILIEFLNKCERANELFLQHKENNLDVPKNNIEYVYEEQEIHFENVCINQDIGKDNKIIESIEENIQFSKINGNATQSPVKHTCQYCSKVFTRKFNLKLHIMRHSGQVPQSRRSVTRRSCPAPGCGKTFTSITNLNTHIRRHNGERPYKCTECGKTFRSSTTLNDHKRIHTGVKPYMCPTCGKRFTTNKLSVHMRTHATSTQPARAVTSPHASGTCAAHAVTSTHARSTLAARAPRRLACPLCSARYSHSQSLNKHLRKRHGVKTSPANTIQQSGFT